MTEYLIPASAEEAVQLLEAYHGGALIVAGGTDVLPDIRKGKRAPSCLVDITRIPELTRIEVAHEQMTVGAAVTFAALREHPYVRDHVHALAEAAGSVGATAIQAAATWAGNLIQAMPAADGAIIAIALDAEARIQDPGGVTWRPVLSLFAGPGRSAIDPARQLVTHIRFPIPMTRWGTAWRRAGRRPSLVLPTLNCAVKIVLTPEGDRIAAAAIAMGPVGPCPIRAGDAEAFLVGQAPEAAVFAEAAQAALCDADPRSSILRASRAYRLAVLPSLIEDALAAASDRARAG